mmetsp:Transcript_108030/g.232775  ORF Transcript_108030/g.232775 Transcript_108030/m.232775 type:complete len:256 (-) Transcript_108030:6-773(-)
MVPAIPSEVGKQLLQDPSVQKTIQDICQRSHGWTDAGQALQDPEVQRQILQTCRVRFPEYAAQASLKISEFVNDPEVQSNARQYALMARHYLGQAAGRVGGVLVTQIQQGPTGVRVLAFGGGLFSFIIACLSVLDLSGMLANPVAYTLSAYQVIFSFTVIMFEAKVSWIQKWKGLDRWHSLLIEKAKFLSENLGRGLFYIFIGSLWLCFANLTELLELACGTYMAFIGVLYILLHQGGYAQFAEKVGSVQKFYAQ